MPRFPAGLLLLCTVAAGPALAQDTRAELVAAQRAERTRHLEVYEPNPVEKGFLLLEEKHILERLSVPPDGFYLRFGGLPPGGGIALGPGYRQENHDGRFWVSTSAAWSLKDYRSVDLRAGAERMAGGRIDVLGGLELRDLAEEDFWGLGTASTPEQRTSYRRRDFTLDARLLTRPLPWLRLIPAGGFTSVALDAGLDSHVPATAALFDAGTAPGLEAAPQLGFASMTVDVDYRDEPGNTRAGGRYRAGMTRYLDARDGPWDFTRVDAEFLQVFPIFDKKRNFAVRVLASRVTPSSEGDDVPFYLMPVLGGSTTLRGYRDYRFRDRAALLITGEYRWEAFAGLDLALFLDSGDVAPRWRDIVVGRMKTSAGIGFRFNTVRNVFLRIDTAWGGHEGTRFYIKFGPAF